MRYGYYPGCSLEGISVEYDQSVRSLFSALDIAIEELPDWICCGTLAAPSVSRLLGLATPLWNVALAGQSGFDQLVAPCSACLYHFKSAARQVDNNPTLRSEVETVLELPLANAVPTVHPLEILCQDPFASRIKKSVQRDLSEFKVVCYYGCHISRPAEVMEFDDPEDPQSMDLLLKWIGVEALEWSGKVDCCGAHFSMIKPDIVVDLCSLLFEQALEVGAEAIVVACPMCHANLDTRQNEITERLRIDANLPVLYFSQVLGYALGLDAGELGFRKHLVDPLPVMLEKCGQHGDVHSMPVLAEELVT